ncbi:hypothetical protein V6N12_002996 [Hibiscus sabdariffa]|uniref:Uncharacterized protein n=1 Tax=Hibiscus sabdariffa TaxID=183260 RepID=A0ABR2ECQ8_9ROSI
MVSKFCKTVATTVRTTLAYVIVPMRALGADSWKIVAALMGKHIGGAVNYVAISNALVVSSSVLAVGIAANNSTPETSTSPQVTISSNFTLAPKLNPSSSEKKTNNRKKTKASTEKKLKLKKSQSETIIEPLFEKQCW